MGSVLGIMVRWGVLDDADMNKNMDGGSLCTDAGRKGDGKQRYAFKAHIWFSGRPNTQKELCDVTVHFQVSRQAFHYVITLLDNSESKIT